MNLKLISIALLLAFASVATGQTQDDINKTDQQRRKQGHWIRKYANGTVMYDGTFRNDKPVGEFKRFNSDNSLKSILNYSIDSKEADATIYYPNGFILSKGKYVDQLKEGTWKFYSPEINGSILNQEMYTKNLRNGLSLKFYPDSTPAEKIYYLNGIKNGEWTQYYSNGKIYLKAFYINGVLDGKFESWYDNGSRQYSGAYKNNLRDGKWQIYSEEGILKYEITYVRGITKDKQLDEESSRFFDMIEKNMGKIPDPEKTGDIR
ncbi:MAG: toxin-antitoxin system YwqK family antitoxin [Bacteroidia bacterium]|nr:toxin-antitoxin system YwqK family antitoxin [Bacteroidia bacterium]